MLLILAPIPIHKLSRERAIAKKIASLGSIVFDLSKSEDIGLLNIFESLLFSFKDFLYIKIPIKTKIRLLINFSNGIGNINLKNVPIKVERYVIEIEIINNIIFPNYRYFSLFKPISNPNSKRIYTTRKC